ncbi:MAG: thioredoxin domain-containing protein [Acidobacteriota bacterium]
MRPKIVIIGLLLVAAAVVSAAPPDAKPELPPQDAELLRYVARAMSWHPTSKFKVLTDEKHMTASGPFRLIQVERTGSQRLDGRTTLVIDEPGKAIWFGQVGSLSSKDVGDTVEELKSFVGDFIPELLMKNMRMKVKVDWDVTKAGPSALLPFDLKVDTGYGEFRRPGAVTADGAFVLLGAPLPFDQDPVAYRRELFENSESVMWDHESQGVTVRIVEFSDFECPACRSKWPLIKDQVEKNPKAVLHGMVNFPLPSIHPWAFRAASAAWCVSEMSPTLLPQFKEDFYSLQNDMELSLVTPTSVDFVVGQGLDEQRFRECYLKSTSLDAVHAQMAFGNALGIYSTPSYFINGWEVRAPDALTLDLLVKALLAGEEP